MDKKLITKHSLPTFTQIARLGVVVSCGIALTTLAVSCGSSTSAKEITETRQVSVTPKSSDDGMSSAERFGLSKASTGDECCPHTSAEGSATESMAAAALSDGAGATAPLDAGALQWSVPEGWEQGPERSMRLVTFTMNEGEVECYVSVLRADGGGLMANINRWRRQVNCDELSEQEIASLPRIPALGGEAVFVEASGDYTGMTGPTQKNHTLLGAVCTLPDQTLFVKMIGPTTSTTAQKANFLAFCESLSKRE